MVIPVEVLEYLPYIWVGIAVLFIIIEALTLALTTVWFALGALVGMVCALLGLPWLWQVLLFLVASLVLFIFTRPVAIRYWRVGKEKTNVEGLAGMKAKVLQDVEPMGTGLIKVNGQEWTAVTDGDKSIGAGAVVEILEVRGVKAVVRLPEETKEGGL